MTLVLMLKIAGMAACAGAGFRLGWGGIGSTVWLMGYGITRLIDAWTGPEKGEAE